MLTCCFLQTAAQALLCAGDPYTKILAFTHRKNIQTDITYHRHFLEGGNTSWNPVLLMVHAPHEQHCGACLPVAQSAELPYAGG